MPDDALLRRYLDSGDFADCYATEIDGVVGHAEYVEAFYTTWLFKLERRLLGWFVARPSTDAQARALALGTADVFAAWHVEARTPDQLLLCDFQGRTRSWLSTVAVVDAVTPATRLTFGSAVVATPHARTGRPTLGPVFAALLGFHRLYSRLLLGAAVLRLARRRIAGPREPA